MIPGLRIEVQPSGKKAWKYERRVARSGILVRLTLGTFPAWTMTVARAHGLYGFHRIIRYEGFCAALVCYERFMSMYVALLFSGMLFSLIAATGHTPVVAQQAGVPVRSSVLCAGGRSFEIGQGQGRIAVTFDGRILHLSRKASGIGLTYSSPEASLIIDGQYVAFVLEDDLGFQNCHLEAATPEAE